MTPYSTNKYKCHVSQLTMSAPVRLDTLLFKCTVPQSDSELWVHVIPIGAEAVFQ